MRAPRFPTFRSIIAPIIVAATAIGCIGDGDSSGSGSSGSSTTPGDQANTSSTPTTSTLSTTGAAADPATSAAPSTTSTQTPVVGQTFVVQGESNLIIEGRSFTNPSGTCLQVSNSQNITIRNVAIANCYGVGIGIYRSTNIRIENSSIEDTNSAVYAMFSSGIQVIGNRFKNVDKRKADGSRGQFVQFNNVSGEGNAISDNRGLNEPDKSYPEDLVSLYQSTGTAASPIQITGNCFKGGGPLNTSGGIMTGDGGGGYANVQNNTLVDPGAYGVAIAGGRYITLADNRVFGRRQSFSNVGLYVWNQSGTTCSNNTVLGNQIDFTHLADFKNPTYEGGGCGAVEGWAQNNWAANLATLDCPN